ncbi:TerC family protein [Planctomicrobium sp. SH668]|uniref:TerC family protein n=1 Tax=Planctomicrobium sp. SH668 TaxID=3448126 RepID=UPI003F5B5E15
MSPSIYAAFVCVIAFLIYLDLNVLHRKSHAITVKSALFWTGVWVFVSLLFNVVVYFLYEGAHVTFDGKETTGWSAATDYLTGYLIEYSLSLDNIFVIALIITAFRIPAEHQHRLLFWGILGAAVLRGLMIWGGAAMMHHFEWTIYVFGILLIATAIKMMFGGDEEIDTDNNFVVKIFRRFYPVTKEFNGRRFFLQKDGKWYATPMLVALVLIETSDVMFAVDSIPAVFAVTKDPFIVFTSNIFAILGLRSLYFALAGMMGKFEYLKYALIVLLLFVGVKMLLSQTYKMDNRVSLGIIALILTSGVVASLLFGKSGHAESKAIEGPDGDHKEGSSHE